MMPERVILAVDPGDSHVGVAIWHSDPHEIGPVAALEYSADGWLGLFSQLAQHIDRVVIEEFRLYPGKAPALSWSPMKTSEMIGAMKWIAQCESVPVTMQGADIKIPTRRQCAARGVKWRHRSGHASDAKLHLWYYLLRNQLDGDWI